MPGDPTPMRRRRRANGQCVWCGIPCAPFRFCLFHREESSEYRKGQRSKLTVEDKAALAEKMRRLRAGLYAEGRCIQCCLDNDSLPKKRCSLCREKNRPGNRIRNARKRKSSGTPSTIG